RRSFPHFWPANPHLPTPSPVALLAPLLGGVRAAFVCFVSALGSDHEACQAAPRYRPVLQQAGRAAGFLAADCGPRLRPWRQAGRRHAAAPPPHEWLDSEDEPCA